MLPEITLAIKSIDSARSLIKGFLSMKTEKAVNEKAIELQSIILQLHDYIFTIKSSHHEIVQAKTDLKKEIMNMKQWKRKKNKYELKEIETGVFAYVAKNPKEILSPFHWICANCFDNRSNESIYQIRHTGGYNHIFYCPSCHNEIAVKNPDYKPSPPVIRVRRNSWMDGY